MNDLVLIKLLGIPVIFVLGSLFHFLYKYGGKRYWMSVISPVNESIWEHLKIGYYPFLAYSVIQILILKDAPSNFYTAELIGVYSLLLTILILEWIYPSILKRNVLVLDLFVFFLAILLGQFISYTFITNFTDITIPDPLCFFIVILTTIIFTLLSYKPIKLPLFRDSVDGKYGIKH